MPRPVNKNLLVSLEENLTHGTSGLLFQTISGDKENVVVKVPDAVTYLSVDELENALLEIKRFILSREDNVTN